MATGIEVMATGGEAGGLQEGGNQQIYNWNIYGQRIEKVVKCFSMAMESSAGFVGVFTT